MERDGWDLSGRAAIRLDGLMVGTADRELFNMPLTQLPALCSWAVTFPLGAWNGDIESTPLAAHSLDAALDEVEARFPLASWWYDVRGQISPVEAVPVEADTVEADLWWLLGQVPLKVSQWRDCIRVEPHQDVMHTVIEEYGPKVRIRSMALGSVLNVTLRADWEFKGYGVLHARWSGDFEALMKRLDRHPGLKVALR